MEGWSSFTLLQVVEDTRKTKKDPQSEVVKTPTTTGTRPRSPLSQCPLSPLRSYDNSRSIDGVGQIKD